MNKTIKILLSVCGSIFAFSMIVALVTLTIVFHVLGKVANADTYELGNESISSIKAVVAKRQFVSSSSTTKNGVLKKELEYKSSSVQEDLQKYVEYLHETEDFSFTKDMDLMVVPSTVEMARKSKTDAEKIITLTIEYDAFGYTLTFQKGKGTLNLFE